MKQTGIDACAETALSLRAQYGSTPVQRFLAHEALRALRQLQREAQKKEQERNNETN